MQALCWALAVRHQPIDSTCTEAANYVFFGRFYAKKTWRRIAFAYSASRIISADFRLTKIRRRIWLTAPAWGSIARMSKIIN